MKVTAIIPARYNSSRFPGKPLALIMGKPMIQWVYEKVISIPKINEAVVATDDKRIYDTVLSFGGQAIMTGEFSCGSERVEYAARFIDSDIIINVQGDEPLIRKEMIEKLLEAFNDSSVVMATLKKRIVDKNEIDDTSVVKVITDINDDAIYFSRFPIPFNRNGQDVKLFKHIGVYAYTADFLHTYVNLPISPIEKIESLEQLRVIYNGYKIRVLETEFQTIGVDKPEHIQRIEQEIKENKLCLD